MLVLTKLPKFVLQLVKVTGLFRRCNNREALRPVTRPRFALKYPDRGSVKYSIDHPHHSCFLLHYPLISSHHCLGPSAETNLPDESNRGSSEPLFHFMSSQVLFVLARRFGCDEFLRWKLKQIKAPGAGRIPATGW